MRQRLAVFLVVLPISAAGVTSQSFRIYCNKELFVAAARTRTQKGGGDGKRVIVLLLLLRICHLTGCSRFWLAAPHSTCVFACVAPWWWWLPERRCYFYLTVSRDVTTEDLNSVSVSNSAQATTNSPPNCQDLPWM